MRILLISTVKTGKDGITNVIFNYLRAMKTSEIVFDYVAINNPEDSYFKMVTERGGSLFVVPRSGKTILSYLYKLSQLLRDNQYDAVHIHTNSHTCILELLAAKIGGCKNRIIHSHNTTCNNVFIHQVLTPIFNKLYTQALACGHDAGVWMFGKEPFKIINNGVDTELFSFKRQTRSIYRKKLGLVEESILLGHIGSFIPVKNQQFIVEVFRILHSRNPLYKLILIGDGPLRPSIEKKVEEYKLKGNVIFTGNINNVFEYLNAIDLIVMPSFYEGLPLTLIEQQANGLHCIVSDTITKETDKTGNIQFLSLNSSQTSWANEIETISTHQDREGTSTNAIQKIKLAGYSINEEATKLKEFYLSLSNSYQ